MTWIDNEGLRWFREALVWEQTLARLRSETPGAVVPARPDAHRDDVEAREPKGTPIDDRPVDVPRRGNKVA